MQARYFALAAVAVFVGAAALLLNSGKPDQRVDFGSAVQVWADVVRDVDHFGLVVTRVPTEEEAAIGQQIDFMLHFEGAVDADPKASAYVAAVGARVAANADRKDINYRFHVVDWPFVNAISIPGGNVYVTKGLLDFMHSEAELAFILGHEVTHIDRRHAIERLQYGLIARKVAGNDLGAVAALGHELLAAPYSNQQEFEADAGGVLLAERAGYDPTAAQDLFTRLEAKEPTVRPAPEQPKLMVEEVSGGLADALQQYFATHPPTPDRVREIQRVYDRNGGDWSGHRFYVGASNYRDRTAWPARAEADEWRTYGQRAGPGQAGPSATKAPHLSFVLPAALASSLWLSPFATPIRH